MSSKPKDNYPTWNADTDYAIGFYKYISQLFGVWPFDPRNVFSEIRIIVAFMFQVTMGVHCIREILSSCVQDREVVGLFGLFTASVLVAIKVVVLRLNQTRMAFIITSAVVDWCDVKDPQSRDTMRLYAHTGRIIFTFEAILVTLAIGSLALISLPTIVDTEITGNSSLLASSGDPLTVPIATKRLLPMGTDCFVADFSSALYVSFFAFQVVQLFVNGVGNMGNDAYFFSLTMHVCAQFELLKRRLEKFGYNQDKRICREEFANLVRRHNHLMAVTMNFEKVYNPIVFWVLATNAVHLSILGLEVLICMKSGDLSGVMQVITKICVLYAQLLLYSYAGDCLSSQNSKLRDAAYNCRWYDLSPIIARDFIFVIMKSNQSFRLTAGKVYEMNMNNFKNIIKTMFSYFSMLRIMFNM
nr:olfactory receptor 15 [Gregopimpla kuwanae]